MLTIGLFKAKTKAALWHVGLSALVAAFAAFAVFSIWFPYPYADVSGGGSLFWLVLWVDLCCGPLLTFVLFSTTKPSRELVMDLGLVVVIQLAALSYGLYSVMLAKPLFLVFEVDRFRVVTFADVDPNDLKIVEAKFPLSYLERPDVISVRVPKTGDPDFFESVELSARGVEVSFRPKLWIPYVDQKDIVLARSKSLSELRHLDQDSIARLNKAVQETGLDERDLRYLPMQGRIVTDWIVLVNKESAAVVGFANIDGF